MLATYEGLRVDVQFAEEIYHVSLTALNQARAAAERQQLYLATFIAPTAAETDEYPRKLLLVALTAFFSAYWRGPWARWSITVCATGADEAA